LYKDHEGIAIGHNANKSMKYKVFHAGLWWPSLFTYTKEYCKKCNISQCINKPYYKDALHLFPITTLELFEKWAIDVMGPISPLAH